MWITCKLDVYKWITFANFDKIKHKILKFLAFWQK